MNKTFTLNSIGTVQSNNEQFSLKIDAPFNKALKELDTFSHVIVFWWADKHDNENDRKALQTQLPYANGTVAGVFACRSEYRPNPIAITVCEISEIDHEAGVVNIPFIDAFDGTPVLDLKPYIPVTDRLKNFDVPEWFKTWPEWIEDGPEFFRDFDWGFEE